MKEADLYFVKNQLIKWYGNSLYESIINSFNCKTKSSIRVNTLKTNKEEIYSILENNNITFSLLKGMENVIVFNEYDKKIVDNLEIYSSGKIYMQSISSMLPPLVLSPNTKDHILDMCAAPGSKTSQLAALTNNESCITACELNPIRAERLKYNLSKLGVKRTMILVQDARQLDDFYRFDKILLDAPCSGSGTINFTNNNQSFSEKLLKKCQHRQITLLKKALSLLNKNGELVYSTCSIFKEENEIVIQNCLNSEYEIVPIRFDNVENLELLPSLIDGVITIKPNKYFEGFFIAKIRKK